MIKTYITFLIVGVLSIPLSMFSQNISLSKMLSLQNNSLLKIQDYLEANSWKYYQIATLKDADSSVFHYRISHFLDSLKLRINRRRGYNPNSFYSQLTYTRFEDPAWLEYRFDFKPDDNYSFLNSIVVILPKFYLLSAIDLKLKGFEKHTFHNSIEFSFAEDSVYKSFIKDIELLHIPDSLSYVKFEKPFITKVYKLGSQVIVLTTINSSYSLGIYSRYDYDFLNEAEIELKGKVDFIH